MATIPPNEPQTGTHADPLDQRGDEARHRAGVALIESGAIRLVGQAEPLTPPAPVVKRAEPTPGTAHEMVKEANRWRRRVT